jgi:hypothetical protein
MEGAVFTILISLLLTLLYHNAFGPFITPPLVSILPKITVSSSLLPSHPFIPTSSLPFFQLLQAEINIIVPFHPDLSNLEDPNSFLANKAPLPALQQFLLLPGAPSITKQFLCFVPPEHTLHYASARQSFTMQAVLDSSRLKQDHCLSNNRFRITLCCHL